MKKIKEFLLGTSFMWLPLVGCYIAEMLSRLILNIL